MKKIRKWVKENWYWKKVTYIDVGPVDTNITANRVWESWETPKRNHIYATFEGNTIIWEYFFDTTTNRWMKKDSKGNSSIISEWYNVKKIIDFSAKCNAEYGVFVGISESYSYQGAFYFDSKPTTWEEDGITYSGVKGKLYSLTDKKYDVVLEVAPKVGYKVSIWTNNGNSLPNTANKTKYYRQITPTTTNQNLEALMSNI